MPFPPEDKSFAGLLKDILVRLGLVERRLATGDSTVTSGVTNPSAVPLHLGAIYVRTDTKKVYIAAGTTSAADWVLVN